MLSAAYSGDVGSLKTLLEQGRRPDLKDNHGWTALHHSVVRGHLECVEYLLEHTLQEYKITNMQTHEGETALFLACKDKNISLEIVKTLIKSDPSSVNISNNESQTPLHIACSVQNPAVVELLVNANADLDACDYEEDTPLHVAAQVGSLDCLQILLYAGADTSASGMCGMNALHSAVSNQNVACAKMLLEFVCIDQILTGEYQTTLLMFAAQGDHKELLEILLSKGADPHIQYIGGRFAVDFTEDYDCVEVLLKSMDRNRVPYLDRRIGVYNDTSIKIAKLTCEIFPELFAPFAIEFVFKHWRKSKEDCIHIIQMLLSQLNFEYLFCNIAMRIHIGSPKSFANFLDLVDYIIFYGHDIILGLENNSKEWRYKSPYYIYLDGPLNVWFLRALCCVNPLYSPKLLIEYRKKSTIIRSFIRRESDIPPSWELEFSSEGDVEERFHSLKHLCRCQLRQTLCKNGIVFYKQFQQALKQLNLPLSLQLYLQYLEGCG